MSIFNAIEDWESFSKHILASSIFTKNQLTHYDNETQDILLQQKLFDNAVKLEVPSDQKKLLKIKREIEQRKRVGIKLAEAQKRGIVDVIAYSQLKGLIQPSDDLQGSLTSLCDLLSRSLFNCKRNFIAAIIKAAEAIAPPKEQGIEPNDNVYQAAAFQADSKEWYDFIEQHTGVERKESLKLMEEIFLIGESPLDDTKEHNAFFTKLEEEEYLHSLADSDFVEEKLGELYPSLTTKQKKCISHIYGYLLAFGDDKKFAEIKSVNFKQAREKMFVLARQEFLQRESRFLHQQIVSEACRLISLIKSRGMQAADNTQSSSAQVKPDDGSQNRETLLNDLYRLLKVRVNDAPFMVEVRKHLISDPKWKEQVQTNSVEDLNKQTNRYVGDLRKELMGIVAKEASPSVGNSQHQRERLRSPTR